MNFGPLTVDPLISKLAPVDVPSHLNKAFITLTIIESTKHGTRP